MNHYSTLGVNKDASPEDIKRAYRKLASQNHPDKGGSKEAFQKIQQAYDFLSDPGRRQQYDQPQAQGFSFEFGGPQGFDFNNIFSMFGAQFNHQGHHAQPGGQRQHQTHMSLWVKLEDVAQGGRRPVTIGTQHGAMTIEIDIPHGINDGDHVQYAKIGPNGTDLIINFRIHPNPKWHRNGLNLTMEHQVSVWDCLVGSDTTVTDILGNQLALSIPPLTNPNSLLRLKGRGLPNRQGPAGDLLVRINARMPTYLDPALADQIRAIPRK
jgi:curved DNA-binding protein